MSLLLVLAVVCFHVDAVFVVVVVVLVVVIVVVVPVAGIVTADLAATFVDDAVIDSDAIIDVNTVVMVVVAFCSSTKTHSTLYQHLAPNESPVFP